MKFSWDAPTTNTDGTPIDEAIVYSIYAEGVLVKTGISKTFVRIPLVAKKALVDWTVTASVGGSESEPSEAIKARRPKA